MDDETPNPTDPSRIESFEPDAGELQAAPARGASRRDFLRLADASKRMQRGELVHRFFRNIDQRRAHDARRDGVDADVVLREFDREV